jgi:hypothetical protein
MSLEAAVASPEVTFITNVVNGQIPFGVALLLLLAYVVWRGGLKLDKLTTAVEAVPTALTTHKTETITALSAHKAETTTALGMLATHTTAQADRVIRVIEDRRLAEFGDAIDDLSRSSADHLEPLPRRQPTGSRPATR